MSHQLTVGKQRLVVVTAIALLIMSSALWPSPDDRAEANSQNNSYQPFQCDQPGSSNPQQRRQVVPLKNSGDNGTFQSRLFGTRMFPCLSGTRWTLTAGEPNGSSTTNVAADVRGIYANSSDGNCDSNKGFTYYYAATGSMCLFQIAFSDLVFRDNVASFGAPVLSARSTTVPAPSAKVAHTLRIAPDGPFTVGGPGVKTNLLTTGDSWVAIPWRTVTNLAGILIIAAGLTTTSQKNTICTAGWNGDSCRMKIRTLAGDGTGGWNDLVTAILSGLAAGGDYNILAANLEFYYLFTHDNNAGNDPYVYPPGGTTNPLNSIQLPNTTITVTAG